MGTGVVRVIRILLAIFGGGLFILGLLLVAAGGPAWFAGVELMVFGGAVLIVVVLERQRYRSEAAERDGAPTGPGGGEPNGLPPQFQATEERFIDPTTNRQMRVWTDPRTGERRYRAEAETAPGAAPH